MVMGTYIGNGVTEDIEDLEDSDLDDIDAVLEDIGGTAEDEDFAERRRMQRITRRTARRPAQRVQTAAGRSPYRSPPSQNPVPQAQMREALDKVAAEIRRNAAAITQLNTRLNTINSRLDTVSQVNTQQTKAISAVKKRVEAVNQGMLFSALLSGGAKSFTLESAVTAGSTTIPAGTDIRLKEKGGTLDRLLPVLATGGLDGGGGGSGGLMSNPLLLVLLLGKD